MRFDLTPDEKIQMRLEAAAQPADTVTVSQGVKVALSVEANRSVSPLIIDLDPATRKLKITHAKEER